MPKVELDAQRARVLNRLLDDALDRPSSDRMAWVETLSADVADLKPHLRDLLSHAAEIETGDFLGALPRFTPPKTALHPDEHAPQPDALIGPYRLLYELGQGGMGSVWLAERIDGLLTRQVALKLPHGAWSHGGLAERLLRERDILAALEHPHIARLYDAGLTADGQPYLALEYVEGKRIDEYCRVGDGRPGMDVAHRLQLFLQVAGAVAYAHGKLVLHRDLKPANILVTLDGTAKLLDFGIAKLMADGEARETRLTQFSGRALSPDYASPEQIRGEALSVASDVYSLGVLLYELLAGVRPYQLKRNSRGELEDAILYGDPRRPSELAAQSDRRALRGDLDTIVLQTLKKERTQRYPTVHALIDDLGRALDGRPVSARPDTLGYRTGKYVRRHRVAVTAAALLGVTLVAGIVGTTVGMIRARRAEAVAQTEVATAERYSKFLVDLLAAPAPEHSKGKDVSAREILQNGTAEIRKELAAEPLLKSRLLATIGWVYTRMGLYADARPILDEAVATARSTGKVGNVELAQALFRHGQVERYLNEPGQAESDDREAIAILEQAYGANDVRVEPALTELGLLFRMSDPEQALRLHRRSYDLRVAAYGEADGDAAVILQNMGVHYFRLHRYQEAKDAYERALPNLKRRFGERDPHIGAVLGNLANVYRGLGEYERAVEMAQQGLEVDTSVSGPEHPDVGIAWMNLARSTDKLGDARLAVEQIDKAIKIFEQRLTPAHPLRIQAANARAAFLIEMEQLGEARKTLEQFAATDADSLDTRRSLLHGSLILAEVERLQGHWLRSQGLAERVLADPAARGDRFLEAEGRWAHAYALAVQAKTKEAEIERSHALEIESAVGAGAPSAGVFEHAKYYACAGDPTKALAILLEAVGNGYRDPLVLHDPALSALRKLPDFAPIAAAVAVHRAMG